MISRFFFHKDMNIRGSMLKTLNLASKIVNHEKNDNLVMRRVKKKWDLLTESCWGSWPNSKTLLQLVFFLRILLMDCSKSYFRSIFKIQNSFFFWQNGCLFYQFLDWINSNWIMDFIILFSRWPLQNEFFELAKIEFLFKSSFFSVSIRITFFPN